MRQDEIRPRLDIGSWQDDGIVSKPPESIGQAVILIDGVLHVVPPRVICPVDFRPGRGQKNLLVKTPPPAERLAKRCPSRVFQRDGRIDQPAIEKEPAGDATQTPPVLKRHLDSPAREGFRIDPGKRAAMAGLLLGDDPSAGLGHDRESPPCQFGEKRRFSAANSLKG